MTYRKGWTVFFLETGKYISKKCKVCNTKCEVERDKVCHSSSINAMLNKRSKYDIFRCLNANNEWHIRLEQLLLEKEKSVSNKVSKLLQEEINEIKAKYLA